MIIFCSITTLVYGGNTISVWVKVGSTGLITSRVIEPDGKPIKGAKVELFQNGILIKTTATNEKGEFTITDLASGHYWIKVSAIGYPLTSRNLVVKSGENTFDILIEPLIQQGGDDVCTYPAPARGDIVNFLYYLEEPSMVTIKVYNIALELVAEIEEEKDAGWGKTVWDISKVAQGVLIYQIQAKSNLSGKTHKFPIKKLAIIK